MTTDTDSSRVLDPDLDQALRSVLRFAASRSAITSKQEQGILAALSIPQSEAGERKVNCPHCWQPMTQGKDARWRCNNYGEDCPAVRGNLEFSTPTAQTEEVANGQPGYLTAYVSLDGKTVGIDHETDADWHDVRRAHEVLRDRLNERLGAQDTCPVRPAQTEGSGLAALSIPQSEAGEREAVEAAYREGYEQGLADGEKHHIPDDAWRVSEARSNLSTPTAQSEAGERETLTATTEATPADEPISGSVALEAADLGQSADSSTGSTPVVASTTTAQTGLAEELGAIVQGARGKCANTFYVPVKSELCDRILTALGRPAPGD